MNFALQWAQHGIPVFPAGLDKRPLVKWKEWAAPDAAKIAATEFPMIGMPTGAASGFVVLDVDKKNDVDGLASLAALGIDPWKLSSVVTATPSGGYHFWFKSPQDAVRNSAGKIASGVDVRGEGGYVIVPGSPGYQWYSPSTDLNAAPYWPDVFANLLKSEASVLPPTALTFVQIGQGIPWASSALTSECQNVRAAMNGTRNSTLNTAAFNVGRKVGAGYLALEEAEKSLFKAAEDVGLVQEDGAAAVRKTITSGINAGRKVPHHPCHKGHKVTNTPLSPLNAGVLQSDIPKRIVTISTAAQLQATVFEPVKWVIPEFVPEGLTILAGAPKLGKSWLCLDIALAVSSGGECLGAPCNEGAVLYCALEDNHRRLQDRLQKIAPFQNWPAQFQYSTQWPRLDEGGELAIAQWLDENLSARLVIIDTLAVVKPSGNASQSAYDRDTNALRGLHQLAASRGVSIIIVTHTRKAEADDPFDKVSGTLGLTGVADTTLVLTREAGGQGVTLYGRGRDVAEIEKAVQLIDFRWQVLGDPLEVHASQTRQQIIEAIRSGLEAPKDIADILDLDASLVRKTLARMVQAGQILKSGRGKYQLPQSDNVTVVTGGVGC